MSSQRTDEQAANGVLNDNSRSVWDIFAEGRKRIPAHEFAKLPTDGGAEDDQYPDGKAKQNQ